jgi:hypothetical protein
MKINEATRFLDFEGVCIDGSNHDANQHLELLEVVDTPLINLILELP